MFSECISKIISKNMVHIHWTMKDVHLIPLQGLMVSIGNVGATIGALLGGCKH